MALSKENRERLTEATANLSPEYQKQMLEMAESDPNFAGFGLRQADYDRQMNEVRQERDKEKVDYDKWQKFHTDESLPFHKKNQERSEALDSREEAIAVREEAIADLKTDLSEGDDTDLDKVDAVAKRIATYESQIDAIKEGAVTSDKVSEIFNQEAGKVAFNVTKFNAVLGDLAEQHKQDFDKNLSREALVEFMDKNGISDPKDAYEEMTKEDRTEVWKAKETERIEGEVRAKYADEFTRTNHPTDGAGSNSSMGPLEKRIAGLKGQEGLDPGASIDEATAFATNKLMREGKTEFEF